MSLAPPGPITPGVYPGNGKAGLLRANEQQFLFKQQLVPAGTASIAVQLERIKSSFYPFAVSLQIWFTDVNGVASAPGTFEVDAQLSDDDVHYADGLGLTAVNSTTQTGRIELSTLWALFLRVNVKTLTNAVYVWVLASR